MKRFEYRRENISYGQDVIERLNYWGVSGWEVVDIETFETAVSRAVTMKREIEE